MGTVPDSMGGIFDMLKEAALTMQQGGGIGYDFSTIRPKGADVKGVAADAVRAAELYGCLGRDVPHDHVRRISRRGAMMATMRCDHPDIEDFITAKQDPARLRMFNLSVLCHRSLYGGGEGGRAPGTWSLTARSIKTVQARDLWNKIMRATYDYAEPGVIFIDRINADE